MGGILNIIASFFKSSDSQQSGEHVLLSILKLLEGQGLNEKVSPVGQAGILLSPDDHDFFKDLAQSMNERLKEITLSDSTMEVIEKDEHGTAWLVLDNKTSFENLVGDVDQISESIFLSGLGPRMIAAVFRGQFRGNTIYWICNYRTARFYPFIPLESQTRDNELEIEMGDVLSSNGIPLEPYSNWYALWNIPI